MAPAPIDAFICFKSEDELHARQVYELLIAKGLNVFFSRETLPSLGSAQYHDQIDRAIESANHMVVVTSSKENVMAQWVQYEWRLFLGEVLAGRKGGNLISVLAGSMPIVDLPIGLRNFEIIRLDASELRRLIQYFPAPTQKPATSQHQPEVLPGLEGLLSGDQDRIRLGLGNLSAANRSQYIAALKAKLFSPSAVERRSSLTALSLLQVPDLVDHVIPAASDPEPSVRRNAIFLIGKSRIRKAIDVVSLRLSDGNPDVRATARDAHRKLTGGKG